VYGSGDLTDIRRTAGLICGRAPFASGLILCACSSYVGRSASAWRRSGQYCERHDAAVSESAEATVRTDQSHVGRWLLIVGAVVLLAVALTGIGLAVATAHREDQLRGQLGTMREDISELKAQRAKDNHDIGAALLSRTGSAQSAADNALQQAKDAADLADQIRGCVNDYMDTIARAGGRPYRYDYC
jgi:hypothetical protein